MRAKMYSFADTFKRTFRNRFPNKLNTSQTILISIVLHVVVALAVAAFWVSSQISAEAHSANSIVLDLETVKSIQANTGQLQQAVDGYSLPNPDAAKTSGRASNPMRGNMNREAMVMASLASLSQLRETFTFVTQTVSTDSVGGFSPMHGDVPGSEYDSFGRKKGEGTGSVSGRVGGPIFCPAPRGY